LVDSIREFAAQYASVGNHSSIESSDVNFPEKYFVGKFPEIFRKISGKIENIHLQYIKSIFIKLHVVS